jgi:hypothetical protein
LVEACHLGVALNDGVELCMADDLIEVCKPVGCPLLHYVDDTLWPPRAVFLDDLAVTDERAASYALIAVTTSLVSARRCATQRASRIA